MTWSASSEAEELVQGLEDAQAGPRDLEDAIDGMKDPPDDLVDAVDRVRRGLGDAELSLEDELEPRVLGGFS